MCNFQTHCVFADFYTKYHNMEGCAITVYNVYNIYLHIRILQLFNDKVEEIPEKINNTLELNFFK